MLHELHILLIMLIIRPVMEHAISCSAKLTSPQQNVDTEVSSHVTCAVNPLCTYMYNVRIMQCVTF